MSFRRDKISKVSVIFHDENTIGDIREFIKNERKYSCIITKNIQSSDIEFNNTETELLYKAEKIRIYLFGRYFFGNTTFVMGESQAVYPYFTFINSVLAVICNKCDRELEITVILKPYSIDRDIQTHMPTYLNTSFLCYNSRISFAKTDEEYFEEIRKLSQDDKKMITQNKNYAIENEPVYDELYSMRDAGSVSNNNGIMKVVVKNDNNNNNNANDEYRRPRQRYYAPHDDVEILLDSNTYRRPLRMTHDNDYSRSSYGKRRRQNFVDDDEKENNYVQMSNLTHKKSKFNHY